MILGLMNSFKLKSQIISYAILLLLTGTYFKPLVAQHKALNFEHLTVFEGLSQNSVFCILEDSQGFMWFGTRAGGLNRYNGYSFTVFKYNKDNPFGISGNEIISLLEDSKGNIWAGTRNDGLNRFDDKTGKFYQYYSDSAENSSLSDNTINCLCEDLDGQLWIGTNNGLCLYNREKNNFIRYTGSGGLGSQNIKALTYVGKGLLWIGAKSGLYLYDIKNNKVLAHYEHVKDIPSSISDSYVTAIIKDKKDRLWIATAKGGLNRLDNPENGKFIHYQNNPEENTSISSDIIRTLHQDKMGVIWIGTKSALDQLFPEQQESNTPVFIHNRKDINNDRSLNESSIFSFLEDHQGNFWIGTYDGGINYLYSGDQNFEHYKHRVDDAGSLSNNVVISFAINNDGIWVGTEGGGLNLFDRATGKFTHFRMDLSNPNSLTSDYVKSLYIDKDNDLWVGTFNGLHFYDKKHNRFIHYLKGSIVLSIEGGVDDEIWIGTTNSLNILNKSTKNIKYYKNISTDQRSISYDGVNKIYKDRDESIWIGTKLGLNYYDRANDNFVRYLHDKNDQNSLSHSTISAICEDREGNLWIGTLDGLNKYDKKNKRFRQFGEKEGLPNSFITNILSDNDGYLWVTTNKGLSKIDPNTPPDIDNYFGPSKKLVLRNYDSGDGLQDMEFKQNSSCKGKNGELFLGGINGFNIFSPSKLSDNKLIPKIVITELKIFNKTVEVGAAGSPLTKPIWLTETLTLTYRQTVLSFGFVALNYTLPEKDQFAYMMEGVDKEWNYIGNKREANYSNLSPGKYIFHVIGSNNDGIWNEKGTSLKLIVLPPWWGTWWFRILSILFILIIFYSFYFYRMAAVNRQKRILEQNVKKRTSKLLEVNTELEQKQKEVIKQKNILEEQKNKIEKAYDNIELLAKIGANITMGLTIEQIVETTYKSLNSVMKVQLFSIGLYDSENNRLVFKRIKEYGKTLPQFYYNLDDHNRMSVWCFNNQKIALIKDFSKEYINYVHNLIDPAEGTTPNSLIYLPLNLMGKKIGVMSVQSHKKNVYSDYHLNILKNIGIYAAIALDNAETYDKIEKQAIELREQKKSLEETNATKDKFYSILAHDIKNPFGSLLGFLELLSVNFKKYDNEKKLKLIDIANDSAKIIFRLIENLLQWSQAQQGLMPFQPEKTDLRFLMESEMSLFNNMVADKRIDIELNFETADFEIVADRNMLSSIMRNLISNAIKFTPKKGKIRINIRARKTHTLFEISDSGIGIPGSALNKLFQIDSLFTRIGTANEKGTGMGLALCSEFVEKHKGKIWVESAEGSGTTFYFTIPKLEV